MVGAALLAALLAALPARQPSCRAVERRTSLRGDGGHRGRLRALEDDDKPGYSGAPHLYILEEVRSDDVVILQGLIDAARPGHDYVLATFRRPRRRSLEGPALFFRSDMVSERTFGHKDIYTEAGRRTDRWLLRITGYQFDLYVYSSHLKAGSTFQDDRLPEWRRSFGLDPSLGFEDRLRG